MHRCRPLALTIAVAAVAAALAPAAATAKDFCTLGVSGCSNSYPDVQAALDAASAAPGADRVLIGSGTWIGNLHVGGDVTIRGAGAATVLTSGSSTLLVDGRATIQDATISGAPALRVLGGSSGVAVRRTRLIGQHVAAVVAESGSLLLRDSLVDARAAGSGPGVTTATTAPGALHEVELDNVTVLGHGDDPTAPGVDARAVAAGDSVFVTVRDSVIAGFGTRALSRAGGLGVASLSIDYADVFPPSAPAQQGVGTLTVGMLLQADPRFAADGITPAAGSPLIDAATPGAFGAGELDLAGGPRLAAYRCGAPRRDIGAIEATGTCPPAARAVHHRALRRHRRHRRRAI